MVRPFNGYCVYFKSGCSMTHFSRFLPPEIMLRIRNENHWPFGNFSLFEHYIVLKKFRLSLSVLACLFKSATHSTTWMLASTHSMGTELCIK